MCTNDICRTIRQACSPRWFLVNNELFDVFKIFYFFLEFLYTVAIKKTCVFLSEKQEKLFSKNVDLPNLKLKTSSFPVIEIFTN